MAKFQFPNFYVGDLFQPISIEWSHARHAALVTLKLCSCSLSCDQRNGPILKQQPCYAPLDGERCVIPARAAAKATFLMTVGSISSRFLSPRSLPHTSWEEDKWPDSHNITAGNRAYNDRSWEKFAYKDKAFQPTFCQYIKVVPSHRCSH